MLQDFWLFAAPLHHIQYEIEKQKQNLNSNLTYNNK